MAQLGRPGRTATVKEKLWARWKAGESVTEISRAMSVGAKSVRRVLSSNDGCFPRPKKRSSRALSFDERKFIAIGLDDDVSLREISNRIGRSASTVSREIKRHGGRKRYRPVEAEWRAQQLTLRPQPCKLARNPELCAMVAQQLAQRWAAQQISGWLKQNFCDNPEMNISHETIYRSLFIQVRGALKMELVKHLRSRRSMRRSKDAINDGAGRGQIVDAISIRERPAEVADRAVPGHWEGDLIQGSHNSFIATLVERKTRFVMLARVRGKETSVVVPALSAKMCTLPEAIRKSLTCDRGLELASHKRFTIATGMAVYFCDPQSPWQRGSNENTNGLLRQYFPKRTDLSRHSQATLDAVALEMNQRPRATLGFANPADTLASLLR